MDTAEEGPEVSSTDVLEQQQSPAPSILETHQLRKTFPIRRGLLEILRRRPREYVRAVNGVDLRIGRGEVLGLAGESGSGKTVTAEIIAKLQEPSSGRVTFLGEDVTDSKGEHLRAFRRQVSMVFQDPYDSLNPRLRVRDAISEPLRIHREGSAATRWEQVQRSLERVHLVPPRYYADSFPHELSGGERQRVAIARALILEPSLLIADEPTTMLDVSVRAGLLNLLKEMTEESALSMLFISHDFSTLSYVTDRIAIMYLGHIVESGPTRAVLTRRLHPYTQALESAIPRVEPDVERPRVTTSIETSTAGAKGCPFVARCPHRMDICTEVMPPLAGVESDHAVACHLYTVEDRDEHLQVAEHTK